MAKNITQFIPGFSSSSEMIDKCEFLWIAASMNDNRSGNDYGSICGRWCWQTNHKYKGDVEITARFSSGAVGATCCCQYGGAGFSGTVLNYNAKPVNSAVACDHAELCWRIPYGGCCRPDFAGSGENCTGWFKDTNAFGNAGDDYKYCSPSPYCMCTVCNDMLDSCTRCNTVQYNTNMCYDMTTCANAPSGNMYHRCRELYVTAGINLADFPFDSDTNIKPGKPGFRAYAQESYHGSAMCTATSWAEFPAMRGGNKEHFIGMQAGGQDCYGSWVQDCMECVWFGRGQTGGGAANQYSNICLWGRAPYAGSAASGNTCFCGSMEHGGKGLHMYYTLTEEITG
jgi:hypothetical protein